MPQSWLTEISALKFLVDLPDHQGGVIDSSGSNQVTKWHPKLSLDQVTKLYFQDIDDQSNLEEKLLFQHIIMKLC